MKTRVRSASVADSLVAVDQNIVLLP